MSTRAAAAPSAPSSPSYWETARTDLMKRDRILRRLIPRHPDVMLLSRGDPAVFFQRPISATLLVIAIIMLGIIALPAIRSKREEAFAGDD